MAHDSADVKTADPKALRRYQAGIERALALFDTTNEWADYIAFLSRLLKSLQGPPMNTDIPLKSVIARYLAQCLQPSLPSGVHQKALEVYDLIFSVIGRQQLSKDLALYLPGLSHTLSFASLATRPQFLAIYDEYILTLDAISLRPAMRALIMSLLPGIEEETSEDFERTLSTFNRLKDKFIQDNHEEVFWQNLFLASMTSPNRRTGVLVYLTRFLPKLVSQSSSHRIDGTVKPLEGAAKAIVTPEPGLLVRCFATGLHDPQPLVQRGFLDLLVSHLPLDASIFHEKAHVGDLDVLINASTAIVLRRDMGLNRRLWAWFTGSESKALQETTEETTGTPTSPAVPKHDNQSSRYFGKHGLASLIRSISSMLGNPSLDSSVRARPFRIALSLMDRSEIGGPVIEALFVPLLQSLQLYQATAPSQEAFDEVFRSANVFFDGIESKLIASQALSLLQQGELDLIMFIVNNFNLEEEEMTTTHIPLISFVLAENVRQLLSSADPLQADNSIHILTRTAQILEELLVLLPTGILNDRGLHGRNPSALRQNIVQRYSKVSLKSQSPTHGFGELVEEIGSALLVSVFEGLQACLSSVRVKKDLLGYMMTSMDQCIVLVGQPSTLTDIGFLPRLHENVKASMSVSDNTHYQILVGVTRLIATLHSCDPSRVILGDEQLCALVPSLTSQFWLFLISSKPQYHVEAVECVWLLHALSRPQRLVESTIISLLVDELARPNSMELCMQRFSTVWVHSKAASKQVQTLGIDLTDVNTDESLDLLRQPILQIVDASDDVAATNACTSWLKSLPSLNIFFGVIFQHSTKDQTDTAGLGTTLQRLGRLIGFAKGNEAQWKAFCGKTGYRDAVFELCSSLTSNHTVVNSLGVEALRIVRLMVGNDGLDLGDDMLKMLSTRLVASYDKEEFQEPLLDTLQAAFSVDDPPAQPDYLLPVLLEGIASPAIDSTLEKWITLLCTIVPLLGNSTLFSNLLKITGCLCDRVSAYLNSLQATFTIEDQSIINGGSHSNRAALNPERSISNLLSGMEYVLARAHHQTSLSKHDQDAITNGSAADLPSSRSSANDHLTVILCMQDALRTCTKLWLWRSASKVTTTTLDAKSLHYMTSRLRGRGRRILENLIEAEPQECLETFMGLWVEKKKQNIQQGQMLELLQTLDGARPKFMMPAAFNAVYNRTVPNALDRSQKSSLSVNVNSFELIGFLNDYTSALEDDLLEEIWTDCTTFLKEVLSNPMPHRQILFKLLEFIAVLCRKMENTNFGEASRMRRDLADLCIRLFTAVFTIKPQGFDGTGSKTSDPVVVFDKKRQTAQSSVHSENALQILTDILPDLSSVLSQFDRSSTVYSGIITYISGPLLRSRSFPSNVSAELLALLQSLSTAPAVAKAWRKDLTDAFNDTKFFQTEYQFVELGWLPLIRQLAITDKTIMPELLSRLTAPAAAGLFSVGAVAARADADKKAQSTLRRIALLMISVETDYFAPQMLPLTAKLGELLAATPESLPSSSVRRDVYLVLRAIVLAMSQSQLSGIWSLIDNELRDMCSAMVAKEITKFNGGAQLQGAKLLDLLLLMKPEEFQLHEWLFVTDTMDAIYPQDNIPSIALVDQINLQPSVGHTDTPLSPTVLKKPWLCTDDSRDEAKVEHLLSAFFSHLSIRTFESNYGLQQLDMASCKKDLITDVFADSSLQG